MTKTSNGAKSVVNMTITLLRADAEIRGEGELIGSEEDLLARYGVSRPTLRQAAALVAQEQLVRVKRGVAGGYFATRPTVSAVSHMAAIYLQTRSTELPEMLHAVELIRSDMVKLAASRDDADGRARLAQFLEADEAEQAAGYSYRKFLRAERDYAKLLGAMAGNNVLDLFLQIVLELVALLHPDQDLLIRAPDRVDSVSRRRGRIIRAILERDAEIAVLEAERGIRQVEAWAREEDDRRGANMEGTRGG
ncbi:MAG: transcriptional regulator [Bradyrhizobium sp.]|nr:transcriptional regulator [Bradyrhizobium sp.]